MTIVTLVRSLTIDTTIRRHACLITFIYEMRRQTIREVILSEGTDDEKISKLDLMLKNGELETTIFRFTTEDLPLHQDIVDGSNIIEAMFCLYVAELKWMSGEHQELVSTDLCKELSDFLDHIPSDTLSSLIRHADDCSVILEYYFLDAIQGGRMKDEKLQTVIGYCVRDGYTFMSCTMLTLSYSLRLLSRDEVNELTSHEHAAPHISELIHVIFDGTGTTNSDINTLLTCVGMLSRDRMMEMVRHYHKRVACEELLNVSVLSTHFPNKYSLDVDRTIVEVCGVPLSEYKVDNERLRKKIDFLKAVLDQM